MRAGDDEVVFAAQEIISQNFGQREIEKLPIEHRLDLRIAALHRVTDHNDVGIGRKIFFSITSMKLYSALFEKDRHRRINVFLRTADLESALGQSRRHRTHGCAANPDEMKLLRRGLGHAPSLRRELRPRYRFKPANHANNAKVSGENPRRTKIHSRQLACFADYFFLNTSTAFQASSGGDCSYSSAVARYILPSASSG